MRFRAAVVGLGRVGSQYDQGRLSDRPRTHVGAILQRPELDLVAVCDPDGGQRERFHREWGTTIPAYKTLSALLRETQPELLSICTPSETHYDVLTTALAAPVKALFCEKPFCTSLAEAEAVVALANRREVALSINYHRRWDRRIRELARETGEFGPPRWGVATYTKGLYNYGSHWIDLMLDLLGPIDHVQPILGATVDRTTADPSLSAMLQFRSGLHVLLRGVDDVNYELLELDLYFADRMVRVEWGGYRILHRRARQDLIVPGYVNLEPPVGAEADGEMVHGLGGAFAEMVRHLRGERQEQRSSGGNALAVMRVLESIREAHGWTRRDGS